MHNFYFSNNINTKWFIFIGIILHLVAAYYSIGYYSADEHYQIIGPLEKLLDIENTLTWEFEWKIRPWIQPYFYFYITKIINLININDPYVIIFYLRLTSSIIGLISIVFLYNHLKHELNLNNNISKFFIFCFWFYAFLHARTSSENLSISMLIFGVIMFDKIFQSNQNNKYALSISSGIFLGLSIVLKYQIAVSVFCVSLWYLINKLNLNHFKYLITCSFFLIFTLLVSLLFDYYGYGHWHNTYFKYYYANFEAKWFENFGNDPWWYYSKIILEKFFPPVSILVFISFIFFWYKQPKSIFTYISLPVILILSSLSNKELRFLFPVLIFFPFVLSYFFSNTKIFFFKIFIINFVLFFNFLFMIVLFIPATEQVKIYKFLFYNINKEENSKVFYYEDNPYIIDDLEPKFYTSFLPKISKYDEKTNINNSFLIIRKYELIEKLINNKNCNLVHSVYPQKIINLNKNWRDRSFNWYVLKC